MLPYWFSAMTVKAVGKAALRMVDEARSHLPFLPRSSRPSE
jgi:Na+/H+-translocating membrane pyrophosphatase